MGPRSYARNGGPFCFCGRQAVWLQWGRAVTRGTGFSIRSDSKDAAMLQWGRAVTRGTGGRCRASTGRAICFNGAAQLRAERAFRPLRDEITLTRFNGAAQLRAERVERGQPPVVTEIASMGPRSYARNGRAIVEDVAGFAELQWGRAVTRGTGGIRRGRRIARLRLQWGRAVTRGTGACPKRPRRTVTWKAVFERCLFRLVRFLPSDPVMGEAPGKKA